MIEVKPFFGLWFIYLFLPFSVCLFVWGSTNLRTDGLSTGYNKPTQATGSAWPQGPSWLGGCGSGHRRPLGFSQPLSGQASWPQSPDDGPRMRPCPPPHPLLYLAVGYQLWKTFSVSGPLFVWSPPDCLPPGSKSRPSSFVRSPVLKCCRCKSWWSCGTAGWQVAGGEAAWPGWTLRPRPLGALGLVEHFLP